ncbi:MAG TPA: hypothetical protein GX527_02385 [Clostridiaceae bacterium]|nr:hypothetical protein [Clostridiaceae bacterium]
MAADRGHLHHKLMDMGLSQKQSVIILYIASAALGLCAIVLTDKGALSAIILLILVSAFIIAGARYIVGITNDSDEIELEPHQDITSLKEGKDVANMDIDTANMANTSNTSNISNTLSKANKTDISTRNTKSSKDSSLSVKILKKAGNR